MESVNQAPEELESRLSPRIQELYESKLNLRPSKISYQRFEDKLVIVMENTVTRSEQMLNEANQQELAQQVRNVLNQILLPQVKALVEEIVQVQVVDFLTDTSLDTGRTGAIAIWETPPESSARQTRANPEAKDVTGADESN